MMTDYVGGLDHILNPTTVIIGVRTFLMSLLISPGSLCSSPATRYTHLLRFAHQHLDFRIPELHALYSLVEPNADTNALSIPGLNMISNVLVFSNLEIWLSFLFT
jgi:hypothetical protein